MILGGDSMSSHSDLDMQDPLPSIPFDPTKDTPLGSCDRLSGSLSATFDLTYHLKSLSHLLPYLIEAREQMQKQNQKALKRMAYDKQYRIQDDARSYSNPSTSTDTPEGVHQQVLPKTIVLVDGTALIVSQ